MHSRVRGSGRVHRSTESEIADVSWLMGRPSRSTSVIAFYEKVIKVKADVAAFLN
jgi:hypothetical protein